MNWYKKAEKLSASEALFGFMAWLTTKKQVSGPFGNGYECSQAAELISEFIKANNLEEPTDNYHDYIKFPKNASLSQTMSKMPQSIRTHVTPFLKSMGFNEDGEEIKEKPLTKKEKKERQEAHDRFREQEYEHMPA